MWYSSLVTTASNQPVLGRTRCVVWTPRGEGVHPRLARSLDHHGLSVVQVEDQFAALARVVKSHREGPEAGGIVLVPCFPDRLTGVAAVLEAVSRHAPRAVCWWFDTAGGEQIRAVTSEDIARWAGTTPPPEPKIVIPARSKAGPKLRLAGDGPDEPPARTRPTTDEGPDAEPPAGPTSVLSADELAMLLGEDVNGRGKPGVQPGGSR